MKTIVHRVDPSQPDAAAIASAATVLRAGGLVAFPTETVYGLGANALDGVAVARIFEAKGRPTTNPVIVHVSSMTAARQVCSAWPSVADDLAARFWPGPLTLVLPRSPRVPDSVTAGGATLGVRMPSHPVARALLSAADLPVAAPSANCSAGLSPTHAEHVLRDLDGRIDMLLDGGPTPGGIESTVLDVTGPPRLLRPGLVSLAELEAIIGPVTWQPAAASGLSPLPSPGMLARHYAPRTPLECSSEGRTRVEALARSGARIGWLTLGAPSSVPPRVVVRSLPNEPAGYAAGLYAALHELDNEGLGRIVVDVPPDAPEWLALHDRLRRASS